MSVREHWCQDVAAQQRSGRSGAGSRMGHCTDPHFVVCCWQGLGMLPAMPFHLLADMLGRPAESASLRLMWYLECVL